MLAVKKILNQNGYVIFEKNGIKKGTGIRIPATREINDARFSFSRSEVTKKEKKKRNISIPAIERNICIEILTSVESKIISQCPIAKSGIYTITYCSHHRYGRNIQ